MLSRKGRNKPGVHGVGGGGGKSSHTFPLLIGACNSIAFMLFRKGRIKPGVHSVGGGWE